MMLVASVAKILGTRFALSSSEWLTILCMGFISATVRTYGLNGYFIGLLTGYILGIAISTMVDATWFPGQGHVVHRYYYRLTSD